MTVASSRRAMMGWKKPNSRRVRVWTGQFIQDSTLITSVITGSFVSTLPLLLGFIYLQRFLRGGLMAGGVRG